jgi:hypothetical protein
MAQIQSPETYADGQQVTAARLNNQTNGAVLLPGAVTDQTAISGGVASADGLIVHDASASAIRKATVTELLGSGVPVVAASVTGVAGSDLILAGAAGQNVEVSGNLDVTGNEVITGGLTVTGNTTLDAGLNVNGLAAFNVTSAVKIPVGTTGQRPGTPVAGQIRYNSTLDQAEVYSGTEWKAVGGVPFDASGGVITTIDGYKIHTYTVSGTFTPSLTKEGKVEVLVVGGGGGGRNEYAGGGGGGGAVVYGVINIAKNTDPISVVVGSGGAPSSNGGTSYFSSLTAPGGSTGYANYFGGASGNGNAGTGGSSSKSGGGGGGAGSPSLHSWTGGGCGGEGFGSSISGTLVNYGGGGGGAGNSSESGSGSGNYGAWGPAGGGRGANSTTHASVARPNSGGGGGGGTTFNNRNASAGADGVVIIRYRVS